jgi:hypothetical protein
MRRPVETPCIYGWTHYQTIGQTEARLHKSTDEIEDKGKWIKCIASSSPRKSIQLVLFSRTEFTTLSGNRVEMGFFAEQSGGVAEISHAFAEMRQRQFSTSC